jgi:ribosomal protein L16/L10AE
MSLLAPKKTKYRKFLKRIRQIRGNNSKCNLLEYGEFGIQVKEGFFFKDRLMESIRLGALRVIRANRLKNGDIKFRVFPHISINIF